MSEDQYAQQDPGAQHGQPDTDDEQQAHPGATDAMGDRPDHGESSYRGSGRLTGRKAVVTGGDSGIGRAVALAFAREGADVVISHLAEEQSDADETMRVVKAAGRKAVSLPGDLADESYCGEIVERTVRELSGIDILVNNAAYQMARDGLEEIGTEE